ncbi:TIGR01841 family phasin [Herminiimonas sp. CN]|uniref:TIGR01841 family phasin n=1 Tax=Herminiimonas sp. CN TaxID=1349818 RepID=UPI0004743BD1|nr:TIGR01841 family phasin [Herminiimonas sp. CN]
MLSNIKQFSATSKANQDARFAMFTELTQAALDSATKLIELNANVVQAWLADSTVISKQLLSAKDPQEFCSMTASHAEPTTEKMLAYGRHVAGIVSSSQAAFGKVAEATAAETNRNLIELVGNASKNAPVVTEHAMEILKSVIGNASAGYESVLAKTQQAAGVLGEHLAAAANQSAQTVEKAAGSAAKK